MQNNENILREILGENVENKEDKYVMETEEGEIIETSETSDTILFDAEVEENIENNSDENKEIIYDAEDEIKKKELENREISLDEFAKLMEESNDFVPDDYRIPEEQKNVFDNGLQNGKFIPRHRCPMCMFGKKSITELHVRKRFSLKKKRVIGYMSVCANCGHVELYTDKPLDLLKYLSGKIKY